MDDKLSFKVTSQQLPHPTPTFTFLHKTSFPCALPRSLPLVAWAGQYLSADYCIHEVSTLKEFISRFLRISFPEIKV